MNYIMSTANPLTMFCAPKEPMFSQVEWEPCYLWLHNQMWFVQLGRYTDHTNQTQVVCCAIGRFVQVFTAQLDDPYISQTHAQGSIPRDASLLSTLKLALVSCTHLHNEYVVIEESIKRLMDDIERLG